MADSGKLAMFGKSYNTQGDNKAHLCLCTIGDVVVKTPQRLIKIFEGGKLKVDSQQLLYTAGSEDDIDKDGIWLVTTASDDGEGGSKVYLSLDGNKILLASTTDGFISYTSVQSLTASQFVQALENIGLYFQTLDEAKSSGITDGMVYVIDENKLYKAVGGNYTEFEAEIIQSAVSSVQDKSYETLQIGGIFIDGTSGAVSSDSWLSIQIDGSEYALFRDNTVYVRKDVVIDSWVSVSTDGARRGSSGLSLYTDSDGVTLEVDNLVVHNSGQTESFEPFLTKELVSSDVMNIITKAEWDEAPSKIRLYVKYENEFELNDIVAVSLGAGANLASVRNIRDDEKQYIEVELARAPSGTSVMDVMYTYYTDYTDGSDELQTATVSVTVDPLEDYDEDEDLNRYGMTEIPLDQYVEDIVSLKVTEGDRDIRYSADGSGTGLMRGMREATVAGIDPLVIETDNNDSSDAVLDGLAWTVITLIGKDKESGDKCGSLWLDGDTIEAVMSQGGEGDVNVTVSPDGIEAVSVKAVDLEADGALFGNYPSVDGSVEVPADPTSDEHDWKIPDVAWVKEIVRLMIEQSSEQP